MSTKYKSLPKYERHLWDGRTLTATEPIAQRRETVIEGRYRNLAPTTRERVDAALRGEEE